MRRYAVTPICFDRSRPEFYLWVLCGMTDIKAADYTFAKTRDESSRPTRATLPAAAVSFVHRILPRVIICGGLCLTVAWISLLGYEVFSFVSDIPIR